MRLNRIAVLVHAGAAFGLAQIGWGQTSPIANVSMLVQVPPGEGTFAAPLGFAVSGPTGLLVRAVGPSLGNFGVGNTAKNPTAHYFDSSGKEIFFANPAIALDWNAIFASVGAFSLMNFPGSGDTADVESFSAGAYSIEVEDGAHQGGTCLIEAYSGAMRIPLTQPPLPPAQAPGYLSNFSALLIVPAGGSTPPLGFVVSAPAWFLFRAVGPSLAPFGVAHPAAAPSLALIEPDGSNAFTLVNVQPQPADYSFVFASVGAFPITLGAGDFYRTFFLSPGAYSLFATDRSGAGGEVLIEVYANPNLGATVE